MSSRVTRRTSAAASPAGRSMRRRAAAASCSPPGIVERRPHRPTDVAQHGRRPDRPGQGSAASRRRGTADGRHPGLTHRSRDRVRMDRDRSAEQQRDCERISQAKAAAGGRSRVALRAFAAAGGLVGEAGEGADVEAGGGCRLAVRPHLRRGTHRFRDLDQGLGPHDLGRPRAQLARRRLRLHAAPWVPWCPWRWPR